jgi:hypothetical protein
MSIITYCMGAKSKENLRTSRDSGQWKPPKPRNRNGTFPGRLDIWRQNPKKSLAQTARFVYRLVDVQGQNENMHSVLRKRSDDVGDKTNPRALWVVATFILLQAGAAYTTTER